MAKPTLTAAITDLAGSMSAEAGRHLEVYAALVSDMGKRWNLMSRSALERVEEHVIDSAALLKAVEIDGCSVGDLGSGAGLPGVVLAILRPSCQVTLVDSRRSKIVFLEHVVRTMGLLNVRVVHERIEKLVGTEGFDIAVSRALGSTGDTLGPSLSVVNPGGRLVLYKGPKWIEERDEAMELARAAGAPLEEEPRVELPGLERTTTFVVFRTAGERG